ncbi:hypothetical protein A0257_06355 [Hymenobacter psoromatis]|nr:hypothetical protein A0257_06355 [Hymenobacter psoromatis]
MLLPLHSWVTKLAGLSLLLAPALSQAQCPIAASCTPGKATSALASAYGMGIFNVTLGSINNSSGNYTEGYKDFSCVATGAVSTSLTVSTSTPLSITNGPLANENVRVWIDYNNDGVFSTDELAFTSDNKKLHTGSITPPATAVTGRPLRLRVASDFADIPAPTACSTPQYSQDEDYTVTLVANTDRPTAAFAASTTTVCAGAVQFTDQSTGAPTGWLWNFGDGTTSTAQNPAHTFATAGTYQVTLTATNAVGSSTSAATAITYNASVPVAASCAGLAATANCCNYGLTRVRLNTIDNPSADGSAGYQDFTCPQRTSLMVGKQYTLLLTTGGTNAHDTRAWLDLNNDGIFSANEKVAEALNTVSPSFSLTLPATAVLNQPLRLRLVADGVGTNPQPCVAPTLGQVEDYTVTAIPNTSPPTAAFTSTYVAGVCTSPANTFTFTDQTTGSPTGWAWSVSPSTGVTFVGGTSAASQNPQIAFATSGYYTVTLRASNANGSTTAASPTPLLIQAPCLTYCASNGGYAAATSSLWITGVSVSAATGAAAFSNASANSAGGYTFYADQSVPLVAGATQTIAVTTNQTYTHRILIWIDYNHDGVFSNTTGTGGELVYNTLVAGATNSVAVTVPGTVGSTRMRIAVNISNNTPNACATFQGEAEVEDYPVNAGQPLAAREALALPALTVSPNPTPDGSLRVQVSDALAGGLYDLEVLSPLGARLLAQSLRLSPTAPAALDLSALPPGLYLLRLTNAQGQSALRRVVRQ